MRRGRPPRATAWHGPARTPPRRRPQTRSGSGRSRDRARRRAGSSSSSEPTVGQPDGRWGSKTTGANASTPVGHQLAVTRHARLAGLGVGAHSSRLLARHHRRLAVGRPRPHRHQRLGDPSGHELVAAGGVRPLIQVHGALASLAVVVPGLLAGKQLGKAMRPIAAAGHTAVELAAMTRLAVMAIEADPRPNMIRSRTHGPRLTPRSPSSPSPATKPRPRPHRTPSQKRWGGRPSSAGPLGEAEHAWPATRATNPFTNLMAAQARPRRLEDAPRRPPRAVRLSTPSSVQGAVGDFAPVASRLRVAAVHGLAGAVGLLRGGVDDRVLGVQDRGVVALAAVDAVGLAVASA
jgi:hypothetical protein